MRIEVLPLDFHGQGALLEPVDQELHNRAVVYCRKELAGGNDINLARFQKVWVAIAGKEVSGISGFVWRIDVPIFRVSGENAVRSTKMLIDRMRAYFQDQGARGSEVFLHISGKETTEQRCQFWAESLKSVGAVSADRFAIKV
jgi:hypothetical protein